MSQESKSFGFSVVVTAVVAVLVILIMKAMSPVLSGGGGAGEADMSEAAVNERIKPVGRLNTGEPMMAEAAPAAEAAAPAAPASTAAAGGGRSGEEIYSSTCLACHATGAAGAPKLGDTKAWAPRIATGMDALLSSAINGKNAMPPRGTCANCSDEELKGAIEYMVSKSQ